MAVKEGCLETTSILLEMGADANISFEIDDFDIVALHLAAWGNEPRLVECLLDVSDMGKIAECRNSNPIIYAIKRMQLQSVKMLLEWCPFLLMMTIRCRSEILSEDYSAIGPAPYLLHYRAEQAEALPALELLLKYGCSVNASSHFEVPPLAAITASAACKEVKEKFIHFLIDQGADPDAGYPWYPINPLPAAWYYACHIHGHQKWLIRLLMSVSRKRDPNWLLSVVYECVTYIPFIEDEEVPNSTLQCMLDLCLELGFSNNFIMSRIWRKFRKPALAGGRQQNQEEETSYTYLTVPEALTPPSLLKLCRIVVVTHYCPSVLRKYKLPSAINDFLNYRS
ncbi:uncharacterized protein LOC126106191 [Schistocerca cancellata]|uniref:uncharacterized protein LOC126106191 n=1 Tax=Schistocerca cancellata TaxID=274614 RepID=UPI002117AE58|nr:uncharacterized protein LOC126106191 [Schistocerca cancellata]